MPFTSAQTTAIRHYLGYPQVYQYADPRLESAIVQAGGDVDATAEVVDLLAKVANVIAQIDGVALPSAGVQSLDKGDVALYGDDAQIRGMRRIGRGYCARLSFVFGVPVANDIFGERGYAGDAWREQNGRPTLAGLG